MRTRRIIVILGLIVLIQSLILESCGCVMVGDPPPVRVRPKRDVTAVPIGRQSREVAAHWLWGRVNQ